MNKLMSVLAAIALTLLIPGSASAQHAMLDRNPPAAKAVNCQTSFPVTTQDCDAAYYVWEFAVTHNFAAPPNIPGNKPYLNSNGKLPPPKGAYIEYDIYPRPPPGTPRGPQRIVIDTGEGTFAQFSPDHFGVFTEIRFFAGSAQVVTGAGAH